VNPLTESSHTLLNDLDEAMRQLGGIGRSSLYELMAAGTIRYVKIGRRSFIPQTELDRYVASLTPAPVASDPD
jgi:excisionase family DNA binding protein